jgi:hypothetical protein
VAFAPATRRFAANAWHVSRRAGVHEAVVVVLAFVVYFYIRGMVVDRAGEALVRAYDIIALEQDLGIYWELEMQSWILDHYWAIRALNWIYFWGHMPLVIGFAVWLYVRHRRTYFLARNAFLASGAIGVIIYALFPVAPPRLVPFGGYVDTMAIFDRVGYNAEETQTFVNPYAAVPSLHFGWSMLLAVMVATVADRRWGWAVGILWPVAMFFAVILTANHFILDVAAGAIVSFAGLAIAWGLERARAPALQRVDRWRSRARSPSPEVVRAPQ